MLSDVKLNQKILLSFYFCDAVLGISVETNSAETLLNWQIGKWISHLLSTGAVILVVEKFKEAYLIFVL